MQQTMSPGPVDRGASEASVRIVSRSIHRFLAMIVGFLLLGGIWAYIVMFVLDSEDTVLGEASVRLFSLGGEFGFPAAFSALLILAAAGAVWLSTRTVTAEPAIVNHRWRWRILALILTGVAFDEAFVVHETFATAFGRQFGTNAPIQESWVVPYGLASLAVGALMVKPLRGLPAKTRLLMLLGGACYVAGAAGLEVVAAYLIEIDASRSVVEIEVIFEEILEIVGMWLFLGGTLDLLRDHRLRLEF